MANPLLAKAKSFEGGRKQRNFTCTENQFELAKAYFDGEVTAAQVFYALGSTKNMKNKAGTNSWARSCMIFAYRMKWLK